MRNYYYQTPLAPGVNAYFCFRVAGGSFRCFVRLPQGWSFSAKIAQAISEAWCSEAGAEADTMCLIDDYLILADTAEAVETNAHKIKQVICWMCGGWTLTA